MQLSNQEAQRFNHEYVGTEHILLGLIKEGSGTAAHVLQHLEIDLRKIRLEVEKIVQSGPDMVTMGKLPQTPRAKKVIEFAMEEARNLHHNHVGTEHLLLGLLREQEGIAAQVLMNLGMQLDDVKEAAQAVREQQNDGRAIPRNTEPDPRNRPATACNPDRSVSLSIPPRTPALNKFGRDLTDFARCRAIAPTGGWESEIQYLCSLLGRGRKSAAIICESTRIGRYLAADLALRAIETDGRGEPAVSPRVAELRFIELDGGSLAIHPEQNSSFSSTLNQLTREVMANAGIVPVISSVDQILGTAGNPSRFRAALSRGGLQCLCLVTADEHARLIATDPDLRQWLQALRVASPDPARVVELLEPLKLRCERQFGITMTAEALTAAVALSQQHFPAESLLDRATDILKEAIAQVRQPVAVQRLPSKAREEALEQLKTEIQQLTVDDIPQLNRIRQSIEGLLLPGKAEPREQAAWAAIDAACVAEVVAGMLDFPTQPD